ncbi:hypothetical protein SLS62_006722 [Diatrype stigma]|uniref:AAR2 splicing factor homolog n=1 Tax=Diatrype stigma TaxID=117547 RepID=A0AAN9UNX0_9PEZI
MPSLSPEPPTTGDAVFLDGLPAKFTIGCDYLSLSTKAKPFPGFRDIPPGPHLFWVAPTDSTSSRSGFWIVADDDGRRNSRVHVKRWDHFNEVLLDGDEGDDHDGNAIHPAIPHTSEQQQQQQQQQQGLKGRLQQVLPSLIPYWYPTKTDGASTNSTATATTRVVQEQEPDGDGDGDGDAGADVDDLPPAFQDKAAMWSKLTSAITPSLLDSITGATDQDRAGDGGRQQRRNTYDWPVTSTDRVLGESRSSEEAKLYDNDDNGGGSSNSGGNDSGNGNGSADSSASSPHHLRFTFRMDEPLFDPTAKGAERTRQALDPTAWILAVLSSSSSSSSTPTSSANNTNNNDDDNKLLGELQFAFLTGAHLGNLSCLEQWYFLVGKLALRAHGLAAARPRLARDLLRTFHAQLAYADRFLGVENGAGGGGGGGGDVLDMVSADGKAAHAMEKALVTYKARLDETLTTAAADADADADIGEVGQAFAALEAWLRRRRGWDLRADSYLRSGDVMLEDGEVVQAEREDFEDEDERGEFAPVVVGLDGEGRQADRVSWD